MNMSTQLKEKINISVDSIETLTEVDLADLCNITEQAIKAGGGFGWALGPLHYFFDQTYFCWGHLRGTTLQASGSQN